MISVRPDRGPGHHRVLLLFEREEGDGLDARAIAMEAVTPHLQTMIDRGSVLRPDLGLVPLTITPSVAASFDLESDRGILALSVDPAKPAGRAGLQSGDVVTAIDNHPLYNIGDFWHAVSRASD